MRIPCPFRSTLAAGVIAFLVLATSAFPAEPTTGGVRGRVLNPESAQYIYNARVSAVALGTSPTPAAAIPDTFTDNQGYYEFDNLPAGPARIDVNYTGLPPGRAVVVVTPGKRVVADISLTAAPAGKDAVLTLGAFTVAADELSASALAVNNQRYSANVKSVIAVNELGFIGDGSVANALKFVPGVDLEIDNSGYPNGITLSGAPSANVPVTNAGFDVTTSAENPANQAGKQRTVQLMQLSLTNISRIEINRSVTPDMPGSAMAGSVNFVPKTAFEFAKPVYTFDFFSDALQNKLTFNKSAGPQTDRTLQIYPGGDFQALVPVSRRFGFTVTLNSSVTPNAFNQTFLLWNANYLNATHTYANTPLNPDHYNLYQFELDDMLATYTRKSLNLTADYRLYEGGSLTASFTQSYNFLDWGQRQVRWGFSGPAGYDLNKSTLTSTTSVSPSTTNDSVLNNTYYIDTVDSNRQFTLHYIHNVGAWKADLGLSYGNARRQNMDADTGFAFSSLYNFRPVDLTLSGITGWAPTQLSASRNGIPVNPLSLSSFANAGNFTTSLAGVSPSQSITSSLPPLRFKPVYSTDQREQAFGSIGRTIPFWVPTKLQVGFNVTDYRRDTHLDPNLGTNGSGFVYNGTDVPVTQFLNHSYNRSLPGGFGVADSLDDRALADFYFAHRSSFLEVAPGADRQTAISNSKFEKEIIAAGYFRLDQNFFHDRLKVVYGLRYEETTDSGQGPYNDPTGNYRRNSDGQFINSSGAVVAPGVTPALIYTNNSLAAIQATWFERAAKAKKSYGNYFPSVNFNYDVTNRIVARAAYSETIGRPDLLNIAPGITLPDESAAATATNTNTYIKVNDPGLKPWTSRNVALSLEYYSPNLGDVTLRAYRRFVADAYVNQILTPDRASYYLNLYDVNPNDYPGAYVSVLQTIPGTIVTSGLELSGRYSLDALLPSWLAGFQVKYSATRSTLTGGGTSASAFGAQSLYLVPYTAGLGVSYVHNRLSLAVNSKWTSKQRLAYSDPAAVTSVDPDTYAYAESAVRVDVDASFRLTRHFSLFINGRDVNGYKYIQQVYSPTTPAVAKNNELERFQPLWTCGIRGEF